VKVTKLCGPEPLTKWLVLAVVSLQITCAYLLRDTSMFSWKFFLTAYVIGATSNQNLFLAIHEISHNLAFRSALANRLLAIFANLPIGLPYSAAFRVNPYKFPLRGYILIKYCYSPTISRTTNPSASQASTPISPPPSKPFSSTLC
jgi:hypothetical protein